MAYRIETVFEGYVFDVHVWLEGKRITLSYDGAKTWKSTDDIDVTDGVLDLIMICEGLNGTGWKISLKIVGQAKAFYEKSGEIEKKKHSYLVELIEMPKPKKGKKSPKKAPPKKAPPTKKAPPKKSSPGQKKDDSDKK